MPDPLEDALRMAWKGDRSPLPHPSEEALLAYLDTGRDRPAIEAHLARCSRCADVLKDLLGDRLPAASRRWIPYAAAAGILVAAAAWRLSLPSFPGVPAAASVLASAPAFRPSPLPPETGSWEAVSGDMEAVLGDAVHAALRSGSALRREDAAPLRLFLERGAVFLDSPGEGVSLRVEGLEASFSDGSLLAERLDRPALSLFWREAWAAEVVEVRLRAVRGTVRLETLAASRTLREGEQILYDGSAFHPVQRMSWREGGDWRPLGKEGAFRDGRRIFLPSAPASGYVFEALVRKRQDSAEVGLSFTAGGKAWEIPVGDNLLPVRDGWTRLRIEASAGGCRISLGPRTLLCRSAADLAREAWETAERGVGLKAWGGDLEVRSPRWKPAP